MGFNTLTMKTQTGFTLIETLIYLALFGIIMAGVMAMTYAVLQAAGRGQTKTSMQEEAGFLLGKINWALAGVSNATVTPTTLTLSRYGYSLNPVVFNLNGNKLMFQEGGSTALPLNSDSIKISGLIFTDVPALNGRPEGITASATLTSLTPNGNVISQSFLTTKYLRK